MAATKGGNRVGDMVSKQIMPGMWYSYVYGKALMSAQTVEGVSVGSRNGAPSRKGCVVVGQMTQASSR